MKGSYIKPGAELRTSTLAEFAELELSQLVAQSLARPGDVAVGLRLDLGLVDGAGFAEEVDHLVACPAFGVNAGVDHQADGAKTITPKPAIVRDGIPVEADLLAQLLGIECPTFDVAGIKCVLAEFGQARHLLRNRQLHVVARDALMIGGGLVINEGAVGEVGGGDDHPARSRTIRSSGLIVGRHRRLKGRYCLNGYR